MTLEEAQKVAAIIAQADGGGCKNACCDYLIELARNNFPEFEWSDRQEDADWPSVSVVDHDTSIVVRVRLRS